MGEGEYVRRPGNPVWMPEIGLGLGIARGREGLLPARDWLYWYDEQSNQYPTKDLVIFQERQHSSRAELAAEKARQEAAALQQKMDELLQKLRDRNIGPETL